MNIPDPLPTSRHIAQSPVRLVTLIYGVVFLLVGVAGFVPGLTTDFGALSAVGHHSEALLLGIFQVSILHNALHLVFGMAGIAIALASWPPPSQWYLRLGGASTRRWSPGTCRRAARLTSSTAAHGSG